MNSWLKIFLPSDEYKERQMLYFLAEAAVLQVLLILALVAVDSFMTPIRGTVVLIVCLATVIFYVGGRYIFAGIEYTDVDSDTHYKFQRKLLLIKSTAFFSIFVGCGVVFKTFDLFDFNENMLEYVVVALLGGVFLFGTSYISLKRSYEKNKDIM